MATFYNGESGLSVRTKINNVLQHADGTASELVINEAGADVNFRVESDTNANALFVDGGTGAVIVNANTSAASELLSVNGTVATGGGTAAAPGWAFRADATTGIYRAGVQTIGVSTNGTERLRITSTGDVGIGTTSPAAKLHLGGFSGAVDGTKGIRLTNTANTIAMFEIGGSNDSYVGTLSASNFSIRTNNTARMTVVGATGNVGIGTSSPQSDLEVQSKTTGTDAVISLTAAGTRRYQIKALTSVGALAFVDESLASERMRITSTGNVGIGTSSPTSTLTILGPNSAAGGLSLTSTTSDATNKIARVKVPHYTNAEEPVTLIFGLALAATNLVQVGGGSGAENAATDIQFFTAGNNTTTTGTERMRIDSTGNVGIGTTTPGSKLSIVGLPTSSAGLSAGDIWNDGGTLKIV